MKRLAALLFFPPLILFGQERPTTPAMPLPVWEAPLPEAQGYFTVSLNSICSIAVERYHLEYEKKSYPVVECSVETVGGKTARFYFIKEEQEKKSESPFKPVRDAAKVVLPDAEDEKNSDNPYRVLKQYPHSSLSGSVEYRLRSETEVIGLYRSLREAWLQWAP